MATHGRCWGTRATITDPAHVVTAAELRKAFQTRTAATRGPVAVGTVVGVRALSDYDDVFGLSVPTSRPARPNLQVVR